MRSHENLKRKKNLKRNGRYAIMHYMMRKIIQTKQSRMSRLAVFQSDKCMVEGEVTTLIYFMNTGTALFFDKK